MIDHNSAVVLHNTCIFRKLRGGGMFHDGTYDEKISQLNLCYISLLHCDPGAEPILGGVEEVGVPQN